MVIVSNQPRTEHGWPLSSHGTDCYPVTGGHKNGNDRARSIEPLRQGVNPLICGMTGLTGGFRASGREDFDRRSLRLSSKFRGAISCSGLEGSERHGDSGCEASVVPDYMLVNPKALSLGFSLESFQKKRRDAFPANALMLQLA
jgi:hypothetical protein